jgi:hypothetical protein
MKTRKLLRPRMVKNVDGTTNKSGEITEAVRLDVNHYGKKSTHNFFVADIGTDDFLLGYPFFEASQPEVDWANAKIGGWTMISTLDTDDWRVPSNERRR